MSNSKLELFVKDTLDIKGCLVDVNTDSVIVSNEYFTLVFNPNGTFETTGGIYFTVKDLESVIKVCVYYKNMLHLV